MFRTETKVTPGMALRVFADALMVNLSLFVGFAFTLWYYLLAGKTDPTQTTLEAFWSMIGNWAQAAWPLTLICIAVFYLTGFYTYGRFYQGRYKALIIFQAVSQSYL